MQASKIMIVLGFLGAAGAWAEPRLAVHPLAMGNFAPDQAAQLEAQFDVMVARLKGIKVAGSARMEEALTKSAGTNCAARDSCLRFLAEATESLYGMHVRVEVTIAGDVVAVARVVRVDGALVRSASVPVKERAGVPVTEMARQALLALLGRLKLDELPATLSDAPMLTWSPPPTPPLEPVVVAAPPPPTTVVAAAEPKSVGLKSVVGWSLVGAGGATLVTGGVFAALGAAGTAANPPDAAGLVAPERASSAAVALRQSNIGAILIPAGAAVAAAGALVLLIPSSAERSPALSVSPRADGAAVFISGHFP